MRRVRQTLHGAKAMQSSITFPFPAPANQSEKKNSPRRPRFLPARVFYGALSVGGT